MRTSTKLLVLIMTLTGMSPGQSVFQEWKTGWYLRRSVLVDAKDFTREALERLARSMIDLRGGPPFQQLEVFVDKRDAYPISMPDHGSYEKWRRYYDYYGRRPLCVAEVLAFNRSMILRIRDKQGAVTRTVLEGTDPLMLSIGGTAFEILHFGFNDEWRAGRPDRTAHVRAYVITTAPLTPKVCKEAVVSLGQRLPAKSMMVYLRNDPWFVDTSWFPIFYPFQQDAMPLSKLQWQSTSTEYCSSGTP